MPVEHRQFPPQTFLKDAAAAIAGAHADLSGVTVLLPNLHAAPLLGIELGRASGFSCLLLPEMNTFSGLASPVQFLPESCRMTRLYLALRARGWFRENDLWRLSRELVGLFDELTRWNVRLPRNLEDFSAMLERAYRARADEPMVFEARLIHELWHALESDGPGETAAYQTGLARLSGNASGPLYVLAPQPLAPAEASFLSSWSEKAPVCIFSESEHDFYGKVWPREEGGGFKSRAEACSANPPSNLSLFRAKNLEEEAEAAEIKIRQWLMAGRKRIALVALDRLAARRTRALLERAEILVSDETGWTFSTTSASTVLMRLLDSVASDFYHEDMLDLLKSPFIFSGWPFGERKRAAYCLERSIRKNSVVSGLEHYARLDLEPEAKRALDALSEAARCLSGRSWTISEWLDALFSSLDVLGVSKGLAEDLAGEALLEELFRLKRELAEEGGKFGFRAWRHWLDMQLESTAFRDAGIVSPVVFTHLHASRLREFDAVVLLGCDAAHLPGEGNAGIFFNQAVRAELDLPLEDARMQLESLAGLLCRSGEVWASWQALRNGEPNLLSPFFEQLDAFHSHAFGRDLIDRDFARFIPMMRLEAERPGVKATARPAPSVRGELVPESISASGYNSLLACPYQYYAARILGLSPLEEAETALEKADYGSYLHHILFLFHKRHPRLSGLSDAEEKLEKLSEEVFREAVEADYLSRGWSLRWKALIPRYIEWQIERERCGWQVDRVEEGRKVDIPLQCGKKLVIGGRLDRVDASGAGLAVLDYKTQGRTLLKEKLAEPGEDVQLAVYALLLGEAPFEAAFLCLDGEVRLLPSEEIMAESIGERLALLFDEIHDGAGLPAQGIERVCAHCEMRGLCRRDYWS